MALHDDQPSEVAEPLLREASLSGREGFASASDTACQRGEESEGGKIRVDLQVERQF